MKKKKQKRERGPGSVRGLELQSGERLVLVARPWRLNRLLKYLYTLGLYGFWRKRNTFVLTDRRVLVGKGIFGRSERSIPLARIDDASYERRGLAGYADIVSFDRGGRRLERIGPLSPRRAKGFTTEVIRAFMTAPTDKD
jgi:hypothetical protein